MSDETPTDPRDSGGRFVSRAAEKAHQLHTPSDEGVHPMAKILFGWTEAKHAGTLIFWGLAALCIVLILMDLVVPRHESVSIAHATGFYGLWGFAAFAFVVLMGWPLGRLLRKREDYYGDPGGPPADVDPDMPVAPQADRKYMYEGDED